MLVDEGRPAQALLGRDLVAEHVEPAAYHLALDLVVVEPLEARGDVAQRLRHRPRRLAAREAEAALLGDADRGEARGLCADRLDQAGRHQVRVTADDHGFCSARGAVASAIASPIAELLMGSFENERPSGATASLMALETAAAEPR